MSVDEVVDPVDPVVDSVYYFDPVYYAYAVDPVPVDPIPAPATVVVELASVPEIDPEVDEAAPIAESEAARASVAEHVPPVVVSDPDP